MGRPCKICNHHKLLEINDELIRKLPDSIISKRYNVPYHALRRHRINHLQEEVSEAWNERVKDLKERGSKITLGTLEYLNKIVNAWFKNEENLDTISARDIIRVLEFRSKFLNEEQGPTKIEIRWGAGLDEDSKDEYLQIKIPVIKKEKIIEKKEEEKKIID